MLCQGNDGVATWVTLRKHPERSRRVRVLDRFRKALALTRNLENHLQ